MPCSSGHPGAELASMCCEHASRSSSVVTNTSCPDSVLLTDLNVLAGGQRDGRLVGWGFHGLSPLAVWSSGQVSLVIAVYFQSARPAA